MIEIVTGDSRPIFKQIIDGIHLKIATNELVAGTKLPSVRGLAMQLMINSNTVAKAYNELTALGVIESRKGLGLFVCQPKHTLSEQEQSTRLDTAVAHFVSEVVALDYNQQQILKRVATGLEIIKPDNKNDKNRNGRLEIKGQSHE